MDTGTVQPFLEDTYLHTVQTLSTKDTSLIVFNVTSDAASSNAARFRILFSSSTALPVNIITPEPEMKVYPNPVRNQQVNIKFNQLDKGQYTTALYNINGQQLINQSFDHTGGALNKIIYIDKKLPAGIYYLQVTNKAKQFSKRILIE
jgi:hypothetical protein